MPPSARISLRLKNIYHQKELDPTATAEEVSVVQTEGRAGENSRKRQDAEYLSDFDQFLKQLPKPGGKP